MQLFVVSFAILFTEVALIRWISTEIRIFAYLNNLVLLACFMGIGLGCYLSKRKPNLSITSIGLSILIILVNLPFVFKTGDYYVHLFKGTPLLLSVFTDSDIWTAPQVKSLSFMASVSLGIISTSIIFFITLFIFVPLGQILGNILDEHKNIIQAYSINIIASILGVWCFSLYSFTYSPPYIWFALISAALLLLALWRRPIHLISDSLSIILLLLLVVSTIFIPHQNQTQGKRYTLWSPYQKLTILPHVDEEFGIIRGYRIFVNNTKYMWLLDFSDAFIKKYPDYINYDIRKFSPYDMPYMFKKDAKIALILGAGGGNDVAGALRNGVQDVDAVEIDPGIYDLGLEFHPEKPYSDPKVNVIIDDARSFFKKSKKRYDVISFGLLDSHTLSSNYNNTRLDHYVYTEESFQEAKTLLAKDGILTVIFSAPRPWIAKRIYDLLKKAFGTPPLTIFKGRAPYDRYGPGGIMFITGENLNIIEKAIEKNPLLKSFISKNQMDFSKTEISRKPVKLTTDDWPYLYLEKPLIPKMHLTIIGILVLLLIILGNAMLSKGGKLNLHFFFLGAAFLLLEFQNITKSTLLFGSTWLVNTIVISAILVLILFSNLFVSIYNIKNLKPVYLLLVLSALVIYLVPLRLFNAFGHLQKCVIVSIILNLPIFFAGIIFIHSFKKTEHKDLAFGSNLIGATVGGMLESLSFIVGINALLLIVISFYFLSFIFLNRK